MYKVGKCLDCNYVGKLIAKRCQSHYWEYRHKVSERKKYSSKSDKGSSIPSLSSWFEKQINSAPGHCEECGKSLASSLNFIPHAIIAHIWPKRDNYGYPSVADHDENRMFYCIDCHTNFDNKGKDHILSMSSLPLIKHRATIVYHDMTQEEQRKAKMYFDYLIEE